MNLMIFAVLLQANILGDAFGKLWNIIWGAVKWLGKQIAKLFQFLIDIIVAFFTVIYDLIAGLLYLLYKIGVLAVKLFQVLLEAGQLLWSLVVGLIRSMGQLVFSPIPKSPNNAYGEMMGQVMGSAGTALQLNSVATILLFIIWISTAISAIKIISSIRVGGG